VDGKVIEAQTEIEDEAVNESSKPDEDVLGMNENAEEEIMDEMIKEEIENEMKVEKVPSEENIEEEIKEETPKVRLNKQHTACTFDIRLSLTPLGQARQFLETCGT
jgi:hypothetical protein